MTLTRPWAIDAAFPNAADQRKQLAAIYPREGVFPDPTTIAAAGIAYAGTGWGVSARAFGAVLKRGGAPYSQSYGAALVSNDGVVVNAWTIGAAPASGSRIDRLCIRARDTTQGDSATGAPTDGPGGAARTGLPEFLVVAGTAATTPVAPALPAGYEEIAQIQTPSGAASTAGSTITQTYEFAHVSGGPLVFRTTAALLAYTTATYLYAGMTAFALDAPGDVWTWSGSAWEGVWVAYAPVWSGSSGAVTVGASTLTGRYRKVGKTVEFEIYFMIGSGANAAGAGNFRFSLPLAAATAGAGATRKPVYAHLESAGVGFYAGVGMIDPASSLVELIAYGNGGTVFSASSGFAVNSKVTLAGRYQAGY